MGGGDFDDHVAIMGDWMPPSSSPRSLLSSMIGNENKNRPYFQEPELQYDQNKPQAQTSTPGDGSSDSNALTEPKTSSRGGGLMERRAARAGFNAPRLNTESIRHGDLSKEEKVRSPYLTIPPGLSPTTLLDSPVFLTNSLVQPSPTTGKFAFALGGNNQNSTMMMMTDESDNKCMENNAFEDNKPFVFKPIAESKSAPNFNSINRAHASSGPFPGFGISSHPEKSNFSPENTSPPLDDETDPTVPNAAGTSAGGTPAEDGYNWRKYGQKQVKGSEYPRSYYKCTHTNCPVKKKVERSHEGHVTEIIYKGAHTHPKPPPAGRRPPVEGTAPVESMPEGGNLVWPPGVQSNPEVLTLTYPENGPNLVVARDGDPARYEPGVVDGGGVEGSCTFSNEEDNEDDRVTHGSVSLGYDDEGGEESELKRRRIEAYASEVSGATRAIREPRVVVQTTSEVDILDDGYRWRKYGQKVVKGNPNPRSYYKCTSPGCNVRKHVERASHDLKSVITTYEGKHNHDVPAARNSSHANSGTTNQHHTPAAAAAAAVTSGHVQRAEPPPQMHAAMARFERPLLGPIGFPGRPQHMGPGPGFGFGLGLGQQRFASLGLAGFGHHHQGKLPPMQVHPYLGYGPRPVSDMGLVIPKTEPKVEPVVDGGSDGSLAYQQLMSRLPLGPQM
ncbi:Probable WRKY transcription factor 2 [Striga hermonthica]|uniref:Probable WRKY transcription factor 2 n=1 Tax=Striga hermonthica TaxID=68872 RepID=A0A9N7NZ45_STRHE|nr:Probable WRKY transcription factor 2 [Striga hermonthica]